LEGKADFAINCSMKHYAILILLALLSHLPAYAFAADNNAASERSFGLSMHGAPKYTATDKTLSYVNPQAPKGGNIKMAAIGTFDTVNPFSVKGVAAEGLPMVYDRLMQRVWDEPFALYPLIAEYIDIAPDRSWITFHLNPKAIFHDGSSVSAQDVLYSFDTLKQFGRPNMRRIYKLVETAEIISPQSIKFTLGKGYDRETVMILAMMPVLSKAWWSTRKFDGTMTEIPLQNGPYKISEIDQGRRIVYTRVKDYWAKDLLVNAGQYNADSITYEYFRDDTIALESLNKGDLDLRREWDVGKWGKGYNNLDTAQFTKVEIPHSRPERAHGFIFNLRRKPFDDYRVRKALLLAFDQDWVGKNLFHGKFARIESFFPNSALDGSGNISADVKNILTPFKDKLRPEIFNETFKTSDNRPERERFREANALLKEAGWIVENGKRINSTTKAPFTFEVMIASPQEQKIALTFQRSLERLGIEMKIRLLDSATFQDRKSAYDYDMMVFYWQNTLSPGTEQALYWSCAAASTQAQFNFSGICNPALDAVTSKIPDAKTYEELITAAQAIDRILLSEVIMIPLFFKGSDYIALRKTINRPEHPPLYGVVMETLWINPVQTSPVP
jgi:microcin C transport system substrate-binding protein